MHINSQKCLHARRPILRTCHHMLSIGSHADRVDLAAVPLKRAYVLAVTEAPHTRRVVTGPCHEMLAIRSDAHRRHDAAVPVERKQVREVGEAKHARLVV
uniref:Uncharacterized protein n=1 Tax=Chrysotila carterae TaxID=13221 RepID=A0A7S4BUC4_CHRCT